MSTIGNMSHSSRRRSKTSKNSSLSSNYSNRSTRGTPSPKYPRIIASRSPGTPSPTLDKDNEFFMRKTTWPEKVHDTRSLWNYWIATLCSPSVRNGLIISILFLMAVSLVPWNRIEWNKFDTMSRSPSVEETADWEKIIEKKREEQGIIPNGTDSELKYHDIKRDPTYQMVLPFNALTKLNIGPELKALQGAYASTQSIITNLTSSLPDLSPDSLNLTVRLRGFRNSIWDFSEAIGDYDAFLESILNNLQQETKNLGMELSKIQPDDRWQNRLDSQQSRKIAAVWITSYEWLTKELDNTWEETFRFYDKIKDVIKQRIDLEKAFDITQPRMTEEAKKRDFKNFDFPAAYKLLRRISSINSLASEDKTQDSYETRLEDIILHISRALELAGGEAKDVMENLQRSHIQESKTESQDETDENENETNNAWSLEVFEIPSLEEQIEALTATHESYVQLNTYLNDMKYDLGQNLKGKYTAPKERIQVYDYVLSGQQDNDYMKRESDNVKEMITKKNKERKRLRYQRCMEQEEKLKKKNGKPRRSYMRIIIL